MLTPKTIADNMYWLPQTCAYRLVAEGRDLYPWHPLLSGDPDSPHTAGVTMRGQTLSEVDVNDDEWEDNIIEEPT
ncbi:MAG: putative cysteine cluster protein YcgN (CxxCxxCC family) [Loktanella salsilacus]